ncbi:hypothetical protein GGI07_001993 [Coemansia sp. Benny D115]|nr:hypothetical protein GGI07_001993 [Coemansia sp. Benny D115]
MPAHQPDEHNSATNGLMGRDGGYQLAANNGGSTNGPQQLDGTSAVDAQNTTYQVGLKRPYSEFEHLLSAADMYATAGNQQQQQPLSDGHNNSAFASHMPQAKHARHDSLIEQRSAAPVATAAMESAAAAAAAVAAASISYSTAAFPYSTKRSTALLSSDQEAMQNQNYFANCFDPLNPGNGAAGLQLDTTGTGVPLMGAGNGAPHLANQSFPMATAPISTIGNPHYHHRHSRSLSFSSRVDHPINILSQQQQQQQHQQAMSAASMNGMTSPMSAAAAYHQAPPGGGYFYDGLVISGTGSHPSINVPVPPIAPNGGAGGSSSFMMVPAPIPSIPGVTVSPKEKPRRLSVPDLIPTAEEEGIGPAARPRRQKLRFNSDLYTPMWVRNNGQQKEGFCDTCSPGKWLQLKNSAFWYHKQFSHGISSVSGRPFMRPLQARHYDADIIEGLCHQCHQWVPIANAKRRNSVLWFRHAHKCHVYHKPKHEEDDTAVSQGQQGSAQPMQMQGGMKTSAYLPSPSDQLATLAEVPNPGLAVVQDH